MNPKEFEANLQFKSDEELKDLRQNFAARFPFDPAADYSSADIEDMFNYHTTLRVLGDYKESATVFREMKNVIDKFHSSGSSPDESLDFLADWSFMAMNYTEEKPDEFICLPYYEEVLGAFRDAPPKFRAKELKVKLQMAHHFRFWLASKGNPELLEEDLRFFLTRLITDFPGEVEGIMEKKSAQNEWDDAADLSRALYRFYNYGKKPNEAAKFLKQTLELIPKTSDYVEADSADLYLSLGRLYADHSKWETARKYFMKAKEMYSAMGEDFEIFVAQAEGWLEESEWMIKK